jgi:hypothetical protein
MIIRTLSARRRSIRRRLTPLEELFGGFTLRVERLALGRAPDSIGQAFADPVETPETPCRPREQSLERIRTVLNGRERRDVQIGRFAGVFAGIGSVTEDAPGRIRTSDRRIRSPLLFH